MTAIAPTGATIPEVTHHQAEVDGAWLHHVRTGGTGTPILLVHGWPESWWAFRKLIPLLATTHQVIAVDLRGFGDSSAAEDGPDEAIFADDLHHLVQQLGLGPVHVLCQDISGGLGFRFAATHSDDVLSFTAIESTSPASGSRRWPTSITAAPGTSDSWAHRAFRPGCWPVTSESSLPAGPTR